MAKMAAGGGHAGMAIDTRSLDALKLQSRVDPAATGRQAARHFEAYFAQTLLGQMRPTSLAGEGSIANALNSPAAQNWRGMLDQQMAQKLAGVAGTPGDGSATPVPAHSGLGLADVIERQLARLSMPADAGARADLPLSMSTLQLARSGALSQDAPSAGAALNLNGVRRIQNGSFPPAVLPAAGPPRASSRSGAAFAYASGDTLAVSGSPEDVRAAFLAKYLPAARRAEAATGIPAVYILGQAALESGWGKHEIRSADGQRSHNLFGIKATGWSGRVAQTGTTEYRDGQAERVSAEFRAYESYEEAFEDYAKLLVSNPRYAVALKSAGSAEQFAQGLQKAGYATDPRYAEKLSSAIRRAMKVVV